MDAMKVSKLEEVFVKESYSTEQKALISALGAKAKELQYAIEELCNDSREKSLAMTKLDEAIMWMNLTITRRH